MSGQIPNGTPFPPTGQTTLTGIIPSYLYQQFADDDALQTFVEAFNIMQQEWSDWFNQINLPVWSCLSGPLLDWIGSGLYGYPRPTLSDTTVTGTTGPYNTMAYDETVYNEGTVSESTIYVPVTDDIYQRMLTWHLYKGDGFQFTMRWLKQRVHRFLNGANGVLLINDNTDDVSVSCAGVAFTITVPSGPAGQTFQYAVLDGVLQLPFQYTFTVDLA
jgi:hypothetical protein